MRHCVAQGSGDQVAVTAHQHHGTAMSSHRALEVLEVSTLAVATGDQQEFAVDIGTQAFDGGQRGADIGGLGIVVVTHAIQVAHPLAAVLQAGKGAQARQHRVERQADRMPQRQGRQGIGLVVGATDLQFTDRHQVLEFEGQVFLAILFTDTKALEIGLLRPKVQHGRPSPISGRLRASWRLTTTCRAPRKIRCLAR